MSKKTLRILAKPLFNLLTQAENKDSNQLFTDLIEEFSEINLKASSCSKSAYAGFLLCRHQAKPFTSVGELARWLKLSPVSLKLRYLGDVAEKVLSNNAQLQQRLTVLEQQIKGNSQLLRSENLSNKRYEAWQQAVMPNSSTMHNSFFFTRPIYKTLWENGVNYCKDLVRSQKKLTVDDIKAMYKAIGITHSGEFREIKVFHREEEAVYTNFTVGKSYIPYKLVPSEMSYLVDWINCKIELCKSGHYSPILLAAVAGMWFISIHPFDNANGRVRNLIERYILEACSYPMKYSSDLEFTTCIFPQEDEKSRYCDEEITAPISYYQTELEAVIENMLKGLEKSCQFFTQPQPETVEAIGLNCFAFGPT